MKKYVQSLSILKFFFIFIYIFFTNFTVVLSSDSIWDEARQGNKVILIRHSLAPGGGDPAGFKIDDCKTQRNLNKAGIEQSKKIGKIFKDNKISIDVVLSSAWCRCKDTAYYAFGEFKEFSALNSTFSTPYNKNEPRQIKEIKKYLMNWKSEGKNLILVTHYSVITAITNAAPSSGEIVISDKNLNVIGTIKTN
jgi:phosphohistidine phosphatase SixA